MDINSAIKTIHQPAFGVILHILEKIVLDVATRKLL